ncbi:MAG: C4-dicarboxylate ABC transporter [marine bacterium B5-7]|nr:MAG: C4-dicarboxylate ABC transporter [marine bacterium B5-7]
MSIQLSHLPLDLAMFAALIGGILMGYPVSFTLAGVATVFAFLGYAFGAFDLSLLGALSQRVFGLITNDVLIAIPLFVFMGVVLEKSQIAEDLLETMGRLFGSIRGGLGVSVMLVGALLAASTGIVGATVVAMGLIALPTMLRNGYSPSLSCGVVCTSGTLGQIIPPSTLLIILADVMSNAYQQAQFSQGKFSIDTISVGQMFAAAFVPGLLLVTIYIVYLLISARLMPSIAPPMRELTVKPTRREILGAVVPPVLLIFAVLGSILGGVATPSEAASVGAVGAVMMAGARLGLSTRVIVIGAIAFVLLAIAAGTLPVRLQRDDTNPSDIVLAIFYTVLVVVGVVAVLRSLKKLGNSARLKPALDSTLTITSMIFATILTASIFSLVFVGLGGGERIESILTAMPGGAIGALVFCMLLIFILGFFLDFVEITVIVLPLIAPVLILMGHDPMWLAVLIAINLQTSFLTPPFGFSLFYLRGAAPKEITTGQIYRGVIPFIALQAIGIFLIWLFPRIATWLPGQLY